LSHFGAIEIIDSDGAPDVPGVDHKWGVQHVLERFTDQNSEGGWFATTPQSDSKGSANAGPLGLCENSSRVQVWLDHDWKSQPTVDFGTFRNPTSRPAVGVGSHDAELMEGRTQLRVVHFDASKVRAIGVRVMTGDRTDSRMERGGWTDRHRSPFKIWGVHASCLSPNVEISRWNQWSIEAEAELVRKSWCIRCSWLERILWIKTAGMGNSFEYIRTIEIFADQAKWNNTRKVTCSCDWFTSLETEIYHVTIWRLLTKGALWTGETT
jgi:hypothetical protein